MAKLKLKGRNSDAIQSKIAELIRKGEDTEDIELQLSEEFGAINPEDFQSLVTLALRSLADELIDSDPKIQYINYVKELFIVIKQTDIARKKSTTARDLAMLLNIKKDTLKEIYVTAKKDFGLLKTSDEDNGGITSDFINQLRNVDIKEIERSLGIMSNEISIFVEKTGDVDFMSLEKPVIFSEGETQMEVLERQQKAAEKRKQGEEE